MSDHMAKVLRYGCIGRRPLYISYYLKKGNMGNNDIVWTISQSISGIRKSYGMPNNHRIVD
jgi:hypothetical protein